MSLLYKYLSCDRIDVLQAGKIRFTQSSDLNDVHEMRPNIDYIKEIQTQLRLNSPRLMREFYREFLELEFVSRGVRGAIRDLRKRAPDRFRALLLDLMTLFDQISLDVKFASHFDSNMLILSLSRVNDNQVMYGHYSSSHRGFAIGFDAEVLTEHFGKRYGACLPIDVEYSKERRGITADDVTILLDYDKQTTTARIEFKRALFTTKSEDWAYEQEVRCFAGAATGEIKPGTEGLKCPVYLYSFPPEAVRQVILGSNADGEYMNQIQDLCQERYPHAELLRAVPDPVEFSMRIEPLRKANPITPWAEILHKHQVIGGICYVKRSEVPEGETAA